MYIFGWLMDWWIWPANFCIEVSMERLHLSHFFSWTSATIELNFRSFFLFCSRWYTYDLDMREYLSTGCWANSWIVRSFVRLFDRLIDWFNCWKSASLFIPGRYAGWYCTSDEAFVPDSQLQIIKQADGNEIRISSESGHRVEWMEEENYLFKLSSFQDDLKAWIGQTPIIPSIFNQQVQHWLEERELPDLSVSRSTDRLKWGISVPDDPSQRIYVWLDALVNYLTVCGYPGKEFRRFWPPNVQVLGKDILK